MLNVYRIIFLFSLLITKSAGAFFIPDSIATRLRNYDSQQEKYNYALEQVTIFIYKHPAIALSMTDSAVIYAGDDDLLVAQCYLVKAKIYFESGYYNEAESYSKKALLIYDEFKNDKGINDAALYRSGSIFQKEGFEAASKHLQSLLPYYRMEKNYIMRGNIYYQLGKIHHSINSDSTLYYFNTAITHFLLGSDTTAVAKCKFEISKFYHEQKHYYFSFKFLRQAITLFDQQNALIYALEARNYIAEVLLTNHDSSEAKGYLQRTYEIAKEIADTITQANLLSATGDCYVSLNEFELSVIQYRKCYDLYSIAGNSSGMKRTMLKISDAYLYFNETDTAFQILDSVMTSGPLDDSLAAIAYQIKGKIAIKNSIIDEAINNYRLAIDHAVKSGNTKLLGKLYLALAEILFHKTDLSGKNELIEVLDKGLKTSLLLQSKTLESLFHKIIYQVKDQSGNIEDALYHLKLHYFINDSIQSDRYSQRTAAMRVNFEIDRYYLSLELNNEKQKDIDDRISLKKKIRIMMFSGLFILLMAGIIIYFKKQSHNK